MVRYEMKYEYNTKPPNTIEHILGHPTGEDKAVELALFNEHRFSFYFWAKWIQKLDEVPELITFDWHQDLAYPSDEDKTELANINLNDLAEISFYSWARLNPLNDNHILSAAYLDLINNIWVVCKQDNGFEEREIIDLNGKKHKIKLFKSIEELYEIISLKKINNVFFDIDIDFFTIENSTSNDKEFYSYIRTKEIKKLFSIKSNLIKWILKRIEGLTIALEPEHTGGSIKSIKLFSIIKKLWFVNSSNSHNLSWKKKIKKKLEKK